MNFSLIVGHSDLVVCQKSAEHRHVQLQLLRRAPDLRFRPISPRFAGLNWSRGETHGPDRGWSASLDPTDVPSEDEKATRSAPSRIVRSTQSWSNVIRRPAESRSGGGRTKQEHGAPILCPSRFGVVR